MPDSGIHAITLTMSRDELDVAATFEIVRRRFEISWACMLMYWGWIGPSYRTCLRRVCPAILYGVAVASWIELGEACWNKMALTQR